jgi:hypothetical protein
VCWTQMPGHFYEVLEQPQIWHRQRVLGQSSADPTFVFNEMRYWKCYPGWISDIPYDVLSSLCRGNLSPEADECPSPTCFYIFTKCFKAHSFFTS